MWKYHYKNQIQWKIYWHQKLKSKDGIRNFKKSDLLGFSLSNAWDHILALRRLWIGVKKLQMDHGNT